MLTKEDIICAYRLYLDRAPESVSVIEAAMKNMDRKELIQWITGSAEYQLKTLDVFKNPYWHYHTSFDAIGTITKFSKESNLPSPLHLTNFLGVKIRPQFYPGLLDGRAGGVEPPPIPNNWHADIAEWASCLRAVDLADDKFTMLELGCGWGCWMNNLGVAAKSVGKKIKLYGIEADPGHINLARQALTDNGLLRDSQLSHGIAGKVGGVALFPHIQSGADWGGKAIFNPDKKKLDNILKSGKYVKVPIVDIRDLIKGEHILDFLHVDIQGAELDVLTDLFDLLCEKVRYIFVGTHSKRIEADLFDLFLQGDTWKLEMERPAYFNLVNGHPIVRCDGVQTYFNSKL